ncbi:choline kinase [Arcobacter sp. FW59]|nr:choline kinase [Arcobacter sp. FW59]
MNIKDVKKLNIFYNSNISIKLLKSQGFNNISYLITSKTKKYVLRVFKSNKSVNISRKFEYKIQKIANKLNISPKPIFFNKNFMIYEYLEGVHKDNLSKNDLKNLALTIKKLHSIKVKTKPYNLKKDFKKYKNLFEDKKNILTLNKLNNSLKKLKKHKNHFVLSHFDLNPKNILFSENSIKIIDWEYAGTTDSFFDLASICIEFKLSKKEERFLLKNYFKPINLSKNRLIKYNKKLKIFKNIYKSLCFLWFSSQI